MRLTRKQLRKLIYESINEAASKGLHVGTAETHDNHADEIAKNIAKPHSKKPAFKIKPPHLTDNHSGYDFFIKPTGVIGGGLHGLLHDPESGLQIDGGIHIDLPGLSGKKDSHLGAELEISQAIKNKNFNIYAKGKAASHLGLDHGSVHISAPDLSGEVGIHGTFGKGHHKDQH